MKLLLVGLLLGSTAGVAQTTYKCPDKDGKPYYSNISCDRNNRPIGLADPANKVSAPTSTRVEAARLLALMDQASGEPHADKKRTLANEVHARVAAYKASSTALARHRAEAEAGVPQLERQLQEGLVADRASIGWYRGIGDSESTLATRSSLNSAREQADKATERFLRMDVDYQKVAGLYETLFRRSN